METIGKTELEGLRRSRVRKPHTRGVGGLSKKVISRLNSTLKAILIGGYDTTNFINITETT